MNDKQWLDKVVHAATEYNSQRLHTNFQEDEVLKFLDYLHKLYGVEYTKPEPMHRNEPHKMGKREESKTSRTVEMLDSEELPNGDIKVEFDFTSEEVQSFFRMGVIQALQAGLKEAEQYAPDAKSQFHTRQVELTWDQIDSIIITELKECYRTHMERDAESRDYEVIHALNVLLKYYMHFSDYDEWIDSIDNA